MCHQTPQIAVQVLRARLTIVASKDLKGRFASRSLRKWGRIRRYSLQQVCPTIIEHRLAVWGERTSALRYESALTSSGRNPNRYIRGAQAKFRWRWQILGNAHAYRQPIPTSLRPFELTSSTPLPCRSLKLRVLPLSP
jgi:hypothetical protein